MVRPSPVPPYWRVVVGSACAKGSKIRAACSSSIPMPVSSTCRRRVVPFGSEESAVADTMTSPSEVNLMAFPIRLEST